MFTGNPLAAFATMNTLKRMVSHFLHDADQNHYNDYDIFCNDELMGRDFSLMFIRKTRWRDQPTDQPLRLQYKRHTDF